MRIIDITGPIYTDMWSCCPEYPGARITELPQPNLLKGRYPVYCQKFEIGGQTGTYIETKAHVDKTARTVFDVPVEKFIFTCTIINLSLKKPGERIVLKELQEKVAETGVSILPGEAVLLNTGWDAKWRDSDYVEDSPFLSREAGEWLINKGINLLGADFPRFDNLKKPEFPWPLFWDKVEFLLSPVVNLSQIKKNKVKLFAFPLKIEAGYAVPVRAVTIENLKICL